MQRNAIASARDPHRARSPSDRIPHRRHAMKLLGRSQLVAFAAVTIMAVGVGAALANTQHHNPPGQGGKHGSHGVCSPAQVARNKATVVAYYTTAFNDKKPEEAVAKYGGPVYIQHNPLAADGFQAFIDFVKAYTGANPQLHVDIKRVIGECDLVVTHSHITTSPSDRGQAVADIFRLNRKGKVVEHWDVIQPVPETSANDNTMF
jgi:predicted SnoaL-like aldol condensation-catalyzing enzyme